MRVGIKGIHVVSDVVFDKPKGPGKKEMQNKFINYHVLIR